jgi:hypothetical protein
MIEIGPATESEMVLAFLQAEIDSTRYGKYYSEVLSKSSLDRRAIIDDPDMHSARDNQIRNKLLGVVRGYGDGKYLFQGFPAGVAWRQIALAPEEFSLLKYANEPSWVKLSGGTRLVVDGAKNIGVLKVAEDTNGNVQSVVAGIRAEKRYPPLIAVEGEGGFLIMVEGHTRATAYALVPPSELVHCIVGSSPRMRTWAFY